MSNQENGTKNGKPVGSVMVMGGGIAGMQASLDLANSGFLVYLVDKNISIGGVMAQLDKTFPTNDCSTCMISPKLIEVASNPNIEIITRAEVQKVDGEAGNFQVTVKKYPRYVREDKCTGCGECINVCPVDLPADFNQGLNTRKAIYRHFPQAIPSTFAIDKLGTSPCKAACPAGVHAHGYVALIRQGKYKEALKLVKKDNPLPSVCGRVCPHPCESACTRGQVDEPVAIDYLKRFVADLDLNDDEPYMPEVKEKKEDRVAIVGGGPAGLTAAYFLAIEGYPVTIYEAMPEPGGWLIYGIPDYRLPKEIVRKEIELIQKLGVEIKTNVRVGTDITLKAIKDDGYKAIFIATGTTKSRAMGIEGEDLQGVIPGADFLRRVNVGERPELGETVAVIGGGNVAMDTARSALRTGAKKVMVLYRRALEQMPANPEEIEEAQEEGVEFHYLVAPVKITGDENGRVKAIRCIRMELGQADESGRRRPIPIEGSEFEIEVDAVLPAIGLSTDLGFLEGITDDLKPKLSRWQTIDIDPITLATNVDGVFAGGDVVTGAATVIDAIAAGKKVAVSIDRYIRGEDMAPGRQPQKPVAEPQIPRVRKAPRARMPRLSPDERVKSFAEVQLGFSEEEAVKEAERCLNCGLCSECYQCVEVCQAKAIDHDMTEEILELNVGSIIFSPGFETFDARLKAEYGYGRYDNVITSLEFERILSASGPTTGHVVRPGDHKEPKKIAWIQCVGSRDATLKREYCSAVCCMYATKQAIIAKEHAAEIEPTIFYIDIRAMGKGFERYYERAKQQRGVRYVRSLVSRVVEVPETKNLMVQYVDEEGQIQTEEFDMVILSVGLKPRKETEEFAKRLGIDVDEYGFTKNKPFDIVSTTRDGVFACGVIQNPKDIPETVAQASAASAEAQRVIADARGQLVRVIEKPPERPVTGETPRVGVFICHCGINIAGVVDVAAVTEYAKTLPNVVFAEHLLFTCSTDATEHIKEVIKEHKLNRVVVASCSLRTHEPLFQTCLEEAGLNKYLFEMANIRDQCSWVHSDDKEKATEKAKDLVRMAIARSVFLEPLYEFSFQVAQQALVIGGGVAGMTAALNLADQGFFTYLVEKDNELGGQARKSIFFTPEGFDAQAYVNELIEKVQNHEKIKVFTNAQVLDYSGHVGNFTSNILVNGNKESIKYGVAIIATGAVEYQPTEYLYGKNNRVITQLQFHKALANDDESIKNLKDVVMIQCVGSRDEERTYCSRVCCTAAVVNSLKLKELNPDVNVTILYRDIRTFGTKELYYKKAREAGVRFIRYEPEAKPEVRASGTGLEITVFDQSIKRNVKLRADQLVLSAAIVPSPSTREIAQVFKLNEDADGFFMEAHVKLRPIDFANAGFFLCGLGHGPKFLDEAIAHAKGAASRAATLLSKKEMYVGGRVAVVDRKKCAVCCTCVRACPYGVPYIGPHGAAVIEAAICHGCGVCASECPGKAISLQHTTDVQVITKVEGLLEESLESILPSQASN